MATGPLSDKLERLETRVARMNQKTDADLRALDAGSRAILVEIVRAIAREREQREKILGKLSKRAENLARQNRSGAQFIARVIQELAPRRRATRPEADV